MKVVNFNYDEWAYYEAVNTVRSVIDEPIYSIEQAIKFLHGRSDLAEFVDKDVYKALCEAHTILNKALEKVESEV